MIAKEFNVVSVGSFDRNSVIARSSRERCSFLDEVSRFIAIDRNVSKVHFAVFSCIIRWQRTMHVHRFGTACKHCARPQSRTMIRFLRINESLTNHGRRNGQWKRQARSPISDLPSLFRIKIGKADDGARSREIASHEDSAKGRFAEETPIYLAHRNVSALYVTY